MSEIGEVLEEAGELLKAFERPIGASWGRNLSTLALLLAVHCQRVEVDSYTAMIAEVRPFLEAAFNMGQESQSGMEVCDG